MLTMVTISTLHLFTHGHSFWEGANCLSPKVPSYFQDYLLSATRCFEQRPILGTGFVFNHLLLGLIGPYMCLLAKSVCSCFCTDHGFCKEIRYWTPGYRKVTWLLWRYYNVLHFLACFARGEQGPPCCRLSVKFLLCSYCPLPWLRVELPFLCGSKGLWRTCPHLCWKYIRVSDFM